MTRVRNENEEHLARIQRALIELTQRRDEFVRMNERLRERAVAARAALKTPPRQPDASRQRTTDRSRHTTRRGASKRCKH